MWLIRAYNTRGTPGDGGGNLGIDSVPGQSQLFGQNPEDGFKNVNKKKPTSKSNNKNNRNPREV